MCVVISLVHGWQQSPDLHTGALCVLAAVAVVAWPPKYLCIGLRAALQQLNNKHWHYNCADHDMQAVIPPATWEQTANTVTSSGTATLGVGGPPYDNPGFLAGKTVSWEFVMECTDAELRRRDKYAFDTFLLAQPPALVPSTHPNVLAERARRRN